MKKTVTVSVVLGLCFLFLVPQASAQDAIFKSFGANLKAKNASGLTQNLTSQVNLNLNGEEKSVSKSSASQAFSSFLSKHPCTGFEISHTGDAGTSCFAIGKYQHSGGTFRVKLYAKLVNGKYLINEVDIK